MLRKVKQSVLVTLVALGMTAGVAMAGPPERTTLADVASSVNATTGEFSILLAAVGAADPVVLAALDGRRQFTVFAPTDAAFASLLEELGLTAEELLADTDLLTQVLLYHVVPGRRYAEDVLASDRLRTMQRGFLLQSAGVLLDNEGRSSNIIAVDIEAANGVIHVIDRVVLP